MIRPLLLAALGVATVALIAAANGPDISGADEQASDARAAGRLAPELAAGTWINSAPLSLAELRGRVVLVEFWTYSCSNCLRVLPYVAQWHRRYAAQGLVVIGVHTPEFDVERIDGNVRAAVERLHIPFPVLQDNDYRTWEAYGNQFWPALYLIDRTGRIVYHRFGEGSYAQTEAEIRAQLAAAAR
jgi:thiol-disulfide isomerase/thioredoxin